MTPITDLHFQKIYFISLIQLAQLYDLVLYKKLIFNKMVQSQRRITDYRWCFLVCSMGIKIENKIQYKDKTNLNCNVMVQRPRLRFGARDQRPISSQGKKLIFLPNEGSGMVKWASAQQYFGSEEVDGLFYQLNSLHKKMEGQKIAKKQCSKRSLFRLLIAQEAWCLPSYGNTLYQRGIDSPWTISQCFPESQY